MGTACSKAHNSMPAGSVGDVCPSALWRVTSRSDRGQNADPLVSFSWHLYCLFVTLDRGPKETAREEQAVWLFAPCIRTVRASVCLRLCVSGGGQSWNRGKQRLSKDELDIKRWKKDIKEAQRRLGTRGALWKRAMG